MYDALPKVMPKILKRAGIAPPPVLSPIAMVSSEESEGDEDDEEEVEIEEEEEEVVVVEEVEEEEALPSREKDDIEAGAQLNESLSSSSACDCTGNVN